MTIFELVLDPRGPWGVGIVDVANESDARAVDTNNDPAIKAGLTFGAYPIPLCDSAKMKTIPSLT